MTDRIIEIDPIGYPSAVEFCYQLGSAVMAEPIPTQVYEQPSEGYQYGRALVALVYENQTATSAVVCYDKNQIARVVEKSENGESFLVEWFWIGIEHLTWERLGEHIVKLVIGE